MLTVNIKNGIYSWSSNDVSSSSFQCENRQWHLTRNSSGLGPEGIIKPFISSHLPPAQPLELHPAHFM